MHVWTNAHIDMLYRVEQDFDAFVELLGLPMDQAMFDLTDEVDYPIYSPYDTEYVTAWVAWTLMFRPQTTIVWMKKPMKALQAVRHDIKEIWKKCGQYACAIQRDNAYDLVFDNWSVLKFASASTHSVRGMSVNHLVIDGVDDKLHDELFKYVAPTIALSPRSPRIITITPH